MRFLSLATLLTVTGLAEDKLTLKSGEVLTGSVETISSENTIGIKHIATDSNLSLDATKALKIDIYLNTE